MTNRAVLSALLLAAVWSEGSIAAFGPRDDRDSRSPVVLRVLTYNIHHGEGLDGRFDLQRLADIMNSAAPDLIALQEVDRGTTRAGRVDQMAELGRLTGMHPVFGKAMDYQGGAYGVGVLSRQPIRRVRNRRLPGSPDREPRTALTVDVDMGERGPLVQLTTTHLDQGRNSMDQVAQASYLAAAAAPGTNDAAILAGDMNSRPGTPAMQIIARRWMDVFIDPPPNPAGRPRRRIDYVMVRPAASWLTIESRYVDAPLASDHQPVLVVLEWVGASRRRDRTTR
jgi:endonuclease/exonuclease/phosphatase family metal-dependent hydrolase